MDFEPTIGFRDEGWKGANAKVMGGKAKNERK